VYSPAGRPRTAADRFSTDDDDDDGSIDVAALLAASRQARTDHEARLAPVGSNEPDTGMGMSAATGAALALAAALVAKKGKKKSLRLEQPRLSLVADMR
jgi:hypothetical protein